MIGYARAYLAMAGVDLGLSAFSALAAFLLATGSLPVNLSPTVTWLVSILAVIVSLTYLVAGLLKITRKQEN
jgi:hypothetical protein